MCAAVLLGCEAENLRVDVNANSSPPAFRIEREDGSAFNKADLLTVVGCDYVTDSAHTVLWRIRRTSDDADTTTSVTYGRAPLGWEESDKPRPLPPGCYEVGVVGPAGERGHREFTTTSTVTP
jgi:hypothetical protein